MVVVALWFAVSVVTLWLLLWLLFFFVVALWLGVPLWLRVFVVAWFPCGCGFPCGFLWLFCGCGLWLRVTAVVVVAVLLT